ncbi:MAG: metallophosphoesterase family protein [Azospirillaceae bacterium]|nr:metallophosphoesterase family protein [Azospirillaceae bacterium]
MGDVHGERRRLEALLTMITADIAADIAGDADGLAAPSVLVFLGDYVDRGAESRGVLDILCAMAMTAARGDGPVCRFLLGNHEAAMLAFIKDPVAGAGWLNFGGAETLASYGVTPSVGVVDRARCESLRDQLLARLPPGHRAFLQSLESMVVLGDYLFVHAGIRPGIALEHQSQDDLLWIREPFLSSRRDHGKVVVHGHTVVDQPLILANRICIDTGAYDTGRLTALRLRGTDRHMIQTES